MKCISFSSVLQRFFTALATISRVTKTCHVFCGGAAVDVLQSNNEILGLILTLWCNELLLHSFAIISLVVIEYCLSIFSCNNGGRKLPVGVDCQGQFSHFSGH